MFQKKLRTIYPTGFKQVPETATLVWSQLPTHTCADADMRSRKDSNEQQVANQASRTHEGGLRGSI